MTGLPGIRPAGTGTTEVADSRVAGVGIVVGSRPVEADPEAAVGIR
jgi:hypothetical protein